MTSLRTKVSLIIVVPLMVILFFVSYQQYLHQVAGIETRTRLLEEQVGEIIKASLRQGMEQNNRELTGSIIRDISSNRTIKKIWVIDLSGTVKESSDVADKGVVIDQKSRACNECHQFPPESRPQVIQTQTTESLLRVTTPIANESACHKCHSPGQKHLGMLLIDASFQDAEKEISSTLRYNLILSLLISLGVGLGVYLLINQIIVKRVESLHKTLQSFSKGEYGTRTKPAGGLPDELSHLGETFNAMAEQLARHDLDIQKSADVRERAIIEERERIARELHDGIAQLLAYINAKNQAARLKIEKGELETAGQYLREIETQVQKEVIDVRSDILGLKMFTQKSNNLAENIVFFVDQCNQFNDIQLKLKMDGETRQVKLAPNVILQVLRIVQEAVSNIRKHANARAAGVNVTRTGRHEIVISIYDDGLGFDQDKIDTLHRNFGLSMMRERADEIGAVLEIESGEKKGTVINIKLKDLEQSS
jgi:signal transduction histidine kinase